MGDETPAADIDFGKKHPLEHTWTLWFDNPNGRQKLATFGKTLRPVYTFNTVEDFWWCVLTTDGARQRPRATAMRCGRRISCRLPACRLPTTCQRRQPGGGDQP